MSVLLILAGLVMLQLLAVPIGIIMAMKPYGKLDATFTFASNIGLSFPPFLLALLLLLFAAVRTRIFPAGRMESDKSPDFLSQKWWTYLQTHPWNVVWDVGWHAALPAFTLIFTAIAIESRFVRAAMLNVLSSRYIRTARGKGNPSRRVVLRHAFRNVAPLLIRHGAAYFHVLLGSLIIIETIWSYPGLGYSFFSAINSDDTDVLHLIVVLAALAILFVDLLADVACAWLDPKVRRAPRRYDGEQTMSAPPA